MNIDDKLNNMKPKDTPLLVLGYILLGMFLLMPLSAHAGTDNEVTLQQTGDNVIIDIVQGGSGNKVDIDIGLTYGGTVSNQLTSVQVGHNNTALFSVGGANNVIHLVQEGNNNYVGATSTWGVVNCNNSTWCGDVDGDDNNIYVNQYCTAGSDCGDSEVGFHFWGDSNILRWGQGRALTDINDTTFNEPDNSEWGGHTLISDFHGDNNKIVGFQTNGNTGSHSGHTANIWFYADDNEVWAKQINDGVKTLWIRTYNDDNVVSAVQKGNGAHTATVILNGSQPTTMTLLQNSNSAKSYSISQNCQTSGGCNISITQD